MPSASPPPVGSRWRNSHDAVAVIPALVMLAIAVAMLALLPFVGSAHAQTDVRRAQGASGGGPASLDGAWAGSGWVFLPSGAKEYVQCRVHYRRQSNTGYLAKGACATAGVKSAQSASLRKVGENSYQGSFYNSEYDISGTIYVIVRGAIQSVRLTSSAGSALFTLKR